MTFLLMSCLAWEELATVSAICGFSLLVVEQLTEVSVPSCCTSMGSFASLQLEEIVQLERCFIVYVK